MTFPLLVSMTLLFVLVGSWLFFLSYILRNRKRGSLTLKNFEESKTNLKDEVRSGETLMTLLSGIHEVALEHVGNGAQAPLAKLIVAAASQISACPMGALLMVERDQTKFKILAAQGLTDSTIDAVGMNLGLGFTGHVLQRGKTIIVDDIKREKKFFPRQLDEYPFRSIVAIPLKIKNRTVGVLELYSQETGRIFEEKKIRQLHLLTSQGALALENAFFYQNLQKFYLEIVNVLSQGMAWNESPDSDDMLRLYASELAKEMNLPSSIALHVEMAILLRGIGKSQVDQLILHKPGQLTPKEFEEIKKVPQLSQKMIQDVSFLSPAKTMILYHQEQWDGTGYPSGLKGEEIPLGSRIISVLNAFQAMTNDRPYRKALTDGDAMREISDKAGRQFDPKVVEAFIRVYGKVQEAKKSGKTGTSLGQGVRRSAFDNFWEWN